MSKVTKKERNFSNYGYFFCNSVEMPYLYNNN